MQAIDFHRARLLKNEGAVRATQLRIGPACAEVGELVTETQPPQCPDAIRLDRDTHADLAQRRRLLVHLDVEATPEQGVSTSPMHADHGGLVGAMNGTSPKSDVP